MKIFFYSTHTLYSKVLIPLIVKLAGKGHSIYIYKNKPDFLTYDHYRHAGIPASNTFVNRNSFDYVSGIINYSKTWDVVKSGINFTFSRNLSRYDLIIGTTKNLDMLKFFKNKYKGKDIFAIGYQHMPFVVSLRGNFKSVNMPEVCLEVFRKSNPFSEIHAFSEYISDFDISFRGFSYLDSVYSEYFEKRSMEDDKKYVLIFHPGGYRGVITKMGEGKKRSYAKQAEFLRTVCLPVLKEGLIPVIKAHPLAARYHFKEDILEIITSLSRENRDFEKIVVEDKSYYKYAYDSDTIVGFGSSSIYELFSMNVKNIIICDFFGKARSRKFTFMDGIFLKDAAEYNDFWKRGRKPYFTDAFDEKSILNKIYESYSTLFSKDTSEKMLSDMGLS